MPRYTEQFLWISLLDRNIDVIFQWVPNTYFPPVPPTDPILTVQSKINQYTSSLSFVFCHSWILFQSCLTLLIFVLSWGLPGVSMNGTIPRLIHSPSLLEERGNILQKCMPTISDFIPFWDYKSNFVSFRFQKPQSFLSDTEQVTIWFFIQFHIENSVSFC